MAVRKIHSTLGPEPVILPIPDRRAIPWIFMMVYSVFLLWTLPDFAVTWDEPGWFDYGRDQWEWILGASEEPALSDPSNYFHYGSLPSLTAAATHWLFHERLNLLDSDSAHHISNVGWGLVLVACLIVWANRTLGWQGACLAVLLWAFWIRLWADVHNNINDLPGAAAALWAGWAAWRVAVSPKKRLADYLLWGFLMGIAYSTRAPNVYFLAFWILLWAVTDRWVLGRRWGGWTLWGAAAAFLIFMLTVKAANPFLWNRSVFDQVINVNPAFYMSRSVGEQPLWFAGNFYLDGEVPRYYAFWIFAISTPPLTLLLLGLAMGSVVRGRRSVPPHLTLWLFLAVGALAKHLTGMGNYDGIRHFMEGFGPLTLMASHGALLVANARMRLSLLRRRSLDVLLAASVILPLLTAVRIYPYLTGYFNPLAGSLNDAWTHYEADYWGQGLKPAVRWLRSSVDLSARQIYVPEAFELTRGLLPESGNIARLHEKEQLLAAPAGSLLVILNRQGPLRRAYHRSWFELMKGSLDGCPPGWQLYHREGPHPSLPPAVSICIK